MTILFWVSLAGVVYTYVGYPLLIWLLARLRPRPWTAADIAPGISVVVAVHNGKALLPWKIQHLLHLDYPGIHQIVIVSDGSTDGTAELLSSLREPRIKTIILPEHRGKAVALNAGMAEATAEVVLFVDIRPEIAPGAVARLVSNFADPSVGCVAGELLLRKAGHDATSAAVGGIYWRYEQWIRSCEAAFDSPVGVYGGFYAIRRELAVPQPEGIILDDMFEPLSIIRKGYRSVLEQHANVYDTWPENAGAEFQRKVRTLAGNFQLLTMAPWTLTRQNRVLFQLFSHKILRLAVPFMFLAMFGSSIALAFGSLFFAAIAAALSLCLGLAVLGLTFTPPQLRKPAAVASALLVLNAAALAALYKFLFTHGPLWTIWNSHETPSASATLGTDIN